MFQRIIMACLTVFIACTGSVARAQTKPPEWIVSEKLVATLNFSAYVLESFRVSPGPSLSRSPSVMVSVAFAKEGLARELRDMIADGSFILCTTREIVAELYRVLHYPRILKQFKPELEDIKQFIGMVLEQGSISEGNYTIRKIKDDPSDDMFLACAMEAEAEYIVSRDPHLRNLKRFRGIEIIDVKTFMERVRKG